MERFHCRAFQGDIVDLTATTNSSVDGTAHEQSLHGSYRGVEDGCTLCQSSYSHTKQSFPIILYYMYTIESGYRRTGFTCDNCKCEFFLRFAKIRMQLRIRNNAIIKYAICVQNTKTQ